MVSRVASGKLVAIGLHVNFLWFFNRTEIQR
jgi:hypothetical protein